MERECFKRDTSSFVVLALAKLIQIQLLLVVAVQIFVCCCYLAHLTSHLTSLVQMVKKIMTLESMVESLNAELAELGSSDALTRAKQHHDSIVASMRQKFDVDILAANEKIDSLTKKLAEKVICCVQLI